MNQKEVLAQPTQNALHEPATLGSRYHISLLPMISSTTIAIAAIVLFLCAATIGGAAAAKSFKASKNEAENNVYSRYYDWGYQNYRVTNEVKIQIDSLKQESKLEVLNVHDVIYQLEKTEENRSWLDNIIGRFIKSPTVWLEVPGEGVFTVDMKQSEFIIDETRQYVLVRVPSLELSNFRIIYSDVKLLYYEDGGWIHNSVGDGVDKVQDQADAAQNQLMINIQNNQQFYKAAQESTKRVLTDWVKKLNPELPDLTVEVEFMES